MCPHAQKRTHAQSLTWITPNAWKGRLRLCLRYIKRLKIAYLQDVASTVITVSKEAQQAIKAVNRVPQGEQTVATRFDMVTICLIFASNTSPHSGSSTQASMLISLLLSADYWPSLLLFTSSCKSTGISCELLFTLRLPWIRKRWRKCYWCKGLIKSLSGNSPQFLLQSSRGNHIDFTFPPLR